MNGDVFGKRESLSATQIFRGRNCDRFVTMLKCFVAEYLSETLLVWSQNSLKRTPQYNCVFETRKYAQ